MPATIHDTWERRDLLPVIQGMLGEAEEALLCVAFVSSAGVQLLKPAIRRLRARFRLVATTQFATTSPGLRLAERLGADVRVLDPPGSSVYHPKLYLARGGQARTAFIGSANLTAGLLANVELGVLLRDEPEAARAWELGSGLWERGRAFAPPIGPDVAPEPMPAELLARFDRAVRAGDVVETLARGAPNRVVAIHGHGIEVETERSRAAGRREVVPARMFEIAWAALRARGVLTNRELLDDLHVHRSSIVCALLARLPEVEVVSRDPIVLRLVPAA